jgi:hypothetical protein
MKPTTDLELANWLMRNALFPRQGKEVLNWPEDWNYKFVHVVLYFVQLMRSMGFSHDQIQGACRRFHDEGIARVEAHHELMMRLREDDLEQWWNRHFSE